MRALYGIWKEAFVKLSTTSGHFSDKVKYERGFLEGRGLSGDGFANGLDDLTATLAASGLGVHLDLPAGSSHKGAPSRIFVGSVLKTDDVLLMADSEDELRLMYGLLKAWSFKNRFDLVLLVRVKKLFRKTDLAIFKLHHGRV